MDKILNLKNSDSETQRRRRYKQMEMEQNAAKKLQLDGWEVFSPTVVCDRIGVKDGKLFLIEFKKNGQKLTPNQEKIQKTTNNYLVLPY